MTENPHLARRSLLTFLLLAGLTSRVFAQQQGPGTKPSVKAAAKSQQQAASAPRPSSISTEQAFYLVRSTLLTLNDANRSGNYTVLRDLAAPDFQSRNTAADLAQIFSDLRRRKFDLFAAALIQPQLTASELDATGRIRLHGFYPTRPLQIGFDLTFQSTGGEWRLLAISLATPEAPSVSAQGQAAPANGAEGTLQRK